MATLDVKRKLTTILAADAEGYARLKHAEEDATLKTLGVYGKAIDAIVGADEVVPWPRS